LRLLHVTPVASRIADRQEDRLGLAARLLERLVAPRVPVHRVVRVLQKIGAALAGETVHMVMLTYNAVLMEFAVETRGLARVVGAKRALDAIDLHVPPGSFYGFRAPTGAAKSTTFKCLPGLLRPSAGEIRILGLD